MGNISTVSSMVQTESAAPSTVVVILNRASGAVARWRTAGHRKRIQAAFQAAGREAHIIVARADEIPHVARMAVRSSADIVVAAGGDGTVSAVAAELVGTDKALGVLPVGTLNHFARDVGISRRLEDAVRTIAAGRTRVVDCGEVNGQLFLNNASVGLYPKMVIGRDHQRLKLGRGKWLAMFRAGLRAFKRFPVLTVEVDAGDSVIIRRTPLLFVGNNRYELTLLTIGGRSAMDRGELCLYITTAAGRFAMIRLIVRAILGRLEQSRDFEALYGHNFRVDTRRSRLRVALDGEVRTLYTPLSFRSRSKSLRVVVPALEN